MFEWGDLRHFLAVARAGSTLAAAKALGVNQTTVARRIQALEDAIGEKLFDRAAGGYRLTQVGEVMLPEAERVAGSVEHFRQTLSNRSRKVGGVIRVTTNDVFADMLVTPGLGAYAEQFPEAQIEVIITNDRLDISRGEADIAIRAGPAPSAGENIVARRIGSGHWGIYASKAYAERNGVPTNSEELAKHPIIGLAGPLAGSEPDVWKRARAKGATIRNASSTVAHMATAIKNGLGVGAVPCILGEEQGFVLGFIALELDYDVTMITRADIRHLPHVRAFQDFIAARTASLRALLAGPEGAPRE